MPARVLVLGRSNKAQQMNEVKYYKIQQVPEVVADEVCRHRNGKWGRTADSDSLPLPRGHKPVLISSGAGKEG